MKRAVVESYRVRHEWRGTRVGHVLKRGMDVLIACSALVVLAPLLLVIAVAIAATSRGPILFEQERVGGRLRSRDGRPSWEPSSFTMYKFRSMTHDAPADPHRTFAEAFVRGDHEAMRAQSDGAMFKLANDPRVTRVGAFLRKTSLDELPQLLNVVRGEMSLVGPRPALEYEVRHYDTWHLKRFEAVSGITGWWQVTGRSAVEFDEMVRMDTWYIENRSLLLDIKILLLTVGVLMRGRGAA